MGGVGLGLSVLVGGFYFILYTRSGRDLRGKSRREWALFKRGP